MTESGQRIEIVLSKSKIGLMLLGALTFVAIGLWFIIDPPTIENSYWGSPTKIAVVGYASIIFFGLCAFFFIRKLQDNKPGLIIDDTGLTDNSRRLSAGHILRSDIDNISVVDWMISVILPVAIGTGIYFFPNTFFFHRTIRNFLPDGLWSYSLISCLLIVWNRNIHIFWISMAFCLFLLVEVLQYFRVIYGTAGIFDIFTYFAAGSIAIYYNNYFKRVLKLK